MGYPMPPPGALGGAGRPPMAGPGRQDYGWPMGMPPQACEAGRYNANQPPVDWRGAGSVQGSPYPPRPDAAGAWPPPAGYPPAPSPGEAPPGYPGYHSGHVGYGTGPGAEADKGVAPAGSAGGVAPAAAAANVPALADAQAPGGAGGGRGRGADDGDAHEDELPKALTPVERLKGVPLVRAALSERMLTRLRSLGLLGDEEEHKSSLLGSGAGELGASGEAPAAAAAVRAQCTRLGLDALPRSKLPPAMPGPARLPPCTVGLAQDAGLWARFRQRCSTPISAETQAPPIQVQLRASGGGGQVVAPMLMLSGSGAAVPSAAA